MVSNTDITQREGIGARPSSASERMLRDMDVVEVVKGEAVKGEGIKGEAIKGEAIKGETAETV